MLKTLKVTSAYSMFFLVYHFTFGPGKPTPSGPVSPVNPGGPGSP